MPAPIAHIALALSLAMLAGVAAQAAEKVGAVSSAPTGDPLLITAGFLEHHPDLKYRMLGMEAHKRALAASGERRDAEFAKAMRYFRRASYFADKPSQGMVAEMYWSGQGVPADRALAYAWMDLAAERGYRGFLGLRERYWKALDAAARERALREGEAVYARFGDAAAKPRYATQLRRGRMAVTGSRTGFNRALRIEVPGPGGSQFIEGSKFYDERYWNVDKYWAWHDAIWAKPRIGKVTVGELEALDAAPDSRVPETAPEVDAPVPEVPPEPVPDSK